MLAFLALSTSYGNEGNWPLRDSLQLAQESDITFIKPKTYEGQACRP
jgi:hypothetical protein